MKLPVLSLHLQYEQDLVAVRQRTREIAQALGFDTQQQTRLATGVSEIARNAFLYAGRGTAEFFLEGLTSPQLFSVAISDQGPGIPHLDSILDGEYRSKTGMGLGIIGTKRMMDQFRITSESGKGTTVLLGKLLPRRAPLITAQDLPRLLETLSRQSPKSVLDEFREQNQELLRTMEELRRRQEDLTALNRELEDTNRGVVALYAELDEKANHLRRADEMKSKFLSNMSHEFRTPLNSIRALTRLLLERTDGELTGEQETQVTYIRKSAESLAELVDDLLDIAKVEAGKIEIRAVEFEAANLMRALRGMLKPLLVGNSLRLVFEDADQIPLLYSDEAKISQILRNFISNALKFTEAGEVRIFTEYDEAGDWVLFHVRDTGLGIARQDQEHVFEEFTQLDSPLQRRVKGTGLGLPLSRKLAQLLGGEVSVESEVGVGSTFTLRIPRLYAAREPAAPIPASISDPEADTVLVVEDHYETRLAYEKYLRPLGWNVIFARSVREAHAALAQALPTAIVLDIRLQGEDAWDLLTGLKADRVTCKVPIVVATTVDDRSKALALGADEFLAKPVAPEVLQGLLQQLARQTQPMILLVDDEEASRYLTKQLFTGRNVRFAEARDGVEALKKVRSERPDLIILDLSMPEMDGFQVMQALREDAALSRIPIIVSTSASLPPTETALLQAESIAILSKETLLEPETAKLLTDALSQAGLAFEPKLAHES